MKFNFPNLIPIFPLSGVVYFPRTNLPLNVFEKRYLDLVNDCYKKDKLMGMIQNKRDNDVYSVGCLGKISSLKKNNDGRIFINLTGLTRFEVKKEMKNNKLYREFEVEYKKFSGDLVDENTSMNLGEFDFLLEKNSWGLYNLVCSGSTSRLEVAKELINILGLDKEIKIKEVHSGYWKKDYFAPRPDCESLVNKKLDLLGLNIMRDWKICLREYINSYYKNYLS